MIIYNKMVERAALIRGALEANGATGIQFCSLNYAEFCSGIAPSFEAREEYEALLRLEAGARQKIANADENTSVFVQRARDGIRCQFGPNSAVYVGCGYTADNQKSSGLVRPGDTAVPTGQIPSGQMP